MMKMMMMPRHSVLGVQSYAQYGCTVDLRTPVEALAWQSYSRSWQSFVSTDTPVNYVVC